MGKKFDFIDSLGKYNPNKIKKKLTKVCGTKKTKNVQSNHYFYIDSYNALKDVTENVVRYIKPEEELSEEKILALTHMVYGWMPQVLKINTEIGKEVIDILQKMKNIKKFDNDNKELFDYIKKLTPLTKNSVVGTSKLLHFLYPTIYPIYDSRVYHSIRKMFEKKRCSQQKKYTRGDKDILNYIAFVKWVHRISKDKEIMQIIKKDVLDNKFADNKASKIRVIEVFLFAHGN